ncbi:MAG: branched-chain amino acid ABC transporter permease [Alphaproteobacteria bacterium]|nr:branched-chain amino acid ABC transporter permease [Alphaproteobacteria bacterium]
MTARNLLLGLLAVLIAAPAVIGAYPLAVLILVLHYAYLGIAWNVMMGFAGLLSLGHALYVGLGAYVAAALYASFGLPALLGAIPAAIVATLAGLGIGALGFRFRVNGVYFALLTIAFAEFTRILFDHMGWTGGSSGFFLPVEHGQLNPIALRGPPVLFYYVALVMTAGAFVLARSLMRSRLGYAWLAIREDPDSAAASGVDVFRARMAAVAVSSALTSLGGVFYAFYYNNMYPEQIFSMARSIEIILAPIIGGLGTLFGPVLGSFVLTLLGEGTTGLLEHFGWAAPGAKQVIYGLALLVIVMVQPAGLWPWLAKRLRIGRDG